MGPPGAGKTSALRALESQRRGFGRFSVRDYGLDLFRMDDDLGGLVGPPLLDRQQLADDLVMRLFAHYLVRFGGLFDVIVSESYPRGASQCKDAEVVVDRLGTCIAGLVTFSISNSTAQERVRTRLTCQSCGRPQVGNTPQQCDYCQGLASRRPDDSTSRFVQRLNNYREHAEQVMEFYDKRGTHFAVDAEREAGLVVADLDHAVQELVNQSSQVL